MSQSIIFVCVCMCFWSNPFEMYESFLAHRLCKTVHGLALVPVGLPSCLSSKEFTRSTGHVGDMGSVHGPEKPPRRKWQPIPVVSLPGEIPWTEESGGPLSMGSQKS